MKNKLFLSIIVATALSAPVLHRTAFAEPAKSYITEDEMKNKLDSISRAEPDAKKVTVRVEVAPKPRGTNNVVNFMDFDLNKDGALSHDEVGESLFYIFDRDGNEVIDNIEMKRIGVLAFSPMEKKTIAIVDYRVADKPTKTTVTEEEFMKASNLNKFDENGDGLTPLDFLGMTFNRVNVKRDNVIDMYEWKRAYADSVRPRHEEPFNYNG